MKDERRFSWRREGSYPSLDPLGQPLWDPPLGVTSFNPWVQTQIILTTLQIGEAGSILSDTGVGDSDSQTELFFYLSPKILQSHCRT